MKGFEKFYVFYDDNDFVQYCGTAKQLVEGGYFTSINALFSRVSHINRGVIRGKVAVLKGEKYYLIKGRKPYERKETNKRTAKNHKRTRTISDRLARGKEYSDGDVSCT